MPDRQIDRYMIARQRLAELAAMRQAIELDYRDAIGELETAGAALAERARLNPVSPITPTRNAA